MPYMMHSIIKLLKKNPERISKLKPYINKYNWEEIDFTEKPKEWIKFEKIITQLH